MLCSTLILSRSTYNRLVPDVRACESIEIPRHFIPSIVEGLAGVFDFPYNKIMVSLRKYLPFSLLPFLFPPSVFAQARLSDLDNVISSAVSGVIALVGAVFLFQLILAGYHYLGAGTNKEAAARAQHTLTHAFMGFILTISAWIIVNIVGGFFGSTTYGNFNICIGSSC